METDRLLMHIAELRDRVIALARENAALRAERDIAQAQASAWAPRATPEQEAEMRRLMEGPQYSAEDAIAEVDRILGGGR